MFLLKCKCVNIKSQYTSNGYIVSMLNSGYDIPENFTKYHLVFPDIEMSSLTAVATAK